MYGILNEAKITGFFRLPVNPKLINLTRFLEFVIKHVVRWAMTAGMLERV